MRKLNRFWSGLEAVPGLAGVSAEWEDVWGGEAAIGRLFLRSTGRLATCYPCSSPGGDGCPRGVVIHGEDDIVAVCRATPRGCNDIPLTRDQIVIRELDRKALGLATTSALTFTTAFESAKGPAPSTARIGWHHLPGGKRAAVYLTIQHEPQAFAAALSQMLAAVDLPFILASPTARFCRPDSAELLRRAGILLLPLDDCLAWDETGRLVATDRAKALLADFEAAGTVPMAASRRKPRRARVAQICPPPGTRWNELQLVMEDHFLAYAIREEKPRRLGFAEAGFEDRRRGDIADQKWELLLEFARGGGVLREDVLGDDLRRNLRQHISVLGRRLHGLFRIAGDPITKKRDEPYRAAFRIRPKEGITISVPADCTWSQISIIEMPSGVIRFIIETKERYLAGPQEVAERVSSSMVEHTLGELGLLGEEGDPTRVARALLEALRANGTPSRAQDDDDMIQLCGHLCRLTSIEGSPFDFRAERGGWCAWFHAESQAGRM